MRALVITIDLDGPAEYAAIHGLSHPATDTMYRGPLQRFVSLCEGLGATATIFAIGRDVRAFGGARLVELAAAGFEIADHSFGHDYRLSRRDPPGIRDELERSRRVFERELGHPPRGFRAPGYHLSSDLVAALESFGYQYSSSALPSPPYYLAKLGVLFGYRLTGRSSGAMLGSPRITLVPRQPHRHRGAGGLVELPLAVATPARLPVTGASLVLAPAALRGLMVRSLVAQEVVVVNLHGMDLLDPSRDDLAPELRRRQPELGIDIAKRRTILREVLARLAETREVVTAARAAAELDY